MSLLSSRIRNVALRLKRKGITWCTERAGETQSSTVDEHGIDPTEAYVVDSDRYQLERINEYQRQTPFELN